ncbi:DUF624 domain-containing protein (plasmid) [Halarchaeum sp. CBA1220]|uniref:DUF624 domain-containing protein n=1 Tax=Halarchaeum sp. CBA1220 TaxID=1853682 RepID=UPI000F3A810A|nr:DUF624 domain-containing protein [Halarchaeum sp. CBA1220]QLC34814.1 DUF624 domain-containing protein [Halarchaeum sp. CBA1220]
MRSVDTKTVYRSFFDAVGFFYENGPRLILVSLLWFLCSLPVVTLGPATLAAYAAIQSLREGYSIDRSHVRATLRRHGLSAVLLTGVPAVFLGISVLYARQYVVSRSALTLALAVVTTYVAAYTWLLLVPTFVGLATGGDLEPELRSAVRWTGQNAVSAVMVAMGTLLVAIVTGLLTVAFALVFAGIAFSFHLEVLLGPVTEQPEDASSPYEESRRD